MRVLALDYGSARCGCAVSDPTETIAIPIETVQLPDSRTGMARLLALVKERQVDRVLVGLPISLQGQDTQQTRQARKFARRLARSLGERIPVEMHDERFTTRMAQRLPGSKASEDSRAAAHMLESWLLARSR